MRYLPSIGDAAPSAVQDVLDEHGRILEDIQKHNRDMILWRKIATAATVAGALFAAIRLSDIYFAVKARRRAGSQ